MPRMAHTDIIEKYKVFSLFLADWRHLRNNLCDANHNGQSISKITAKM
jgi:hypothetical protein